MSLHRSEKGKLSNIPVGGRTKPIIQVLKYTNIYLYKLHDIEHNIVHNTEMHAQCLYCNAIYFSPSHRTGRVIATESQRIKSGNCGIVF